MKDLVAGPALLLLGGSQGSDGSQIQQDRVGHRQSSSSRAEGLLLLLSTYGRSVVSVEKLLSPPEWRNSSQTRSVCVYVSSKNSTFSLFN